MTLDRKGRALLLADMLAVCLAAFGANYLRFDEIHPAGFVHFEKRLLLDLVLTPIVFFFMGLYRIAWRRASVTHLRPILYAVAARTLLLTWLCSLLGYDWGAPRSRSLLEAILLLLAVGGVRLPARVRRDGKPSPGRIGDVELEGLPRRETARVEMDVIRSSLAGKRVLITGGAGSIGAELARQVAELGPDRLSVLDRNENSIYFTEMELRKRFPAVAIECLVGDILDRPRLGEVMESCSPQIVFHAAAFKHVPVMELNAVEAFKNNVLGTRNVAETAAAIGAERFVLISTDKAVNPVSVMGGTKRLAEMVLRDIPGATRFVSVRFGNVLGSDGSVIPLFRKQIAEGGPVTVTHPEVSRYFMTITEAVQLVLQAASMGMGGEVFLLDMGQPVRILDLARDLIELSGLRPGEDIEIVFTGLRPGEKLHEELHHRGEEWLPTSHGKILRFSNSARPAPILPRLALLERALVRLPGSEMEKMVRGALVDLIPEFSGPRQPDDRATTPEPAAARAACT